MPDPVLSTFNFADVWEAVLPLVAEREALVCGSVRLTYAGLEDRANRLANALVERGVEPGQHIGLYLKNGPEYVEAMLAAFKVRAVPINVNYRYVADELRHQFSDADLIGVIYHRSFAPRVSEIASDLPKLGWYLSVDDLGTPGDGVEVGDRYEDVLAHSSPEADFGPRSGDDRYVIYTGGTTGLPKGVVWRQEDAFFACIGGGDPIRLQGPVDEPAELLSRIINGTFVYLPVAPLMHAAGQWTVLSLLYAGGKVVLLPGSLDPMQVWRTVETEGVNLLTVVGDPVVRPLVDAWEEAGGFDVSSLLSIGSGGAPLTPSLKQRLMELLPTVPVVDGFGSSETGAQGSQRVEAGATSDATQFKPYGDSTTVLDENTHEAIRPGSGEIGRVALRGRIPLGYYNDPVKTEQTFVHAGGHRWVLTGDLATVADDGTISLLGRGSGCINTGGEKVFPEEVEAVLKAHPGVYDALVVGAPDERWGQRVTAIVQRYDASTVTDEELIGHCKDSLAGYKAPRQVVFVDEVQRSPAGKADYRWANRVVHDATPSDF